MEAAFKAINDVTRREILQFLIQGPQNAGQIAKQFDMTKPSISHHLDLLKQAQLIDAVKKGQTLAVMEAMKMEHTIAAPADGTVAELLFAPGDQVTEGAELLRLATA